MWWCAVAWGFETPARVVAARDAIDWAAAGDQAAAHLSEYIRVDTTNPPGHERRGVDWIAGILATEGISAEIVDHGNDRASLVARLPGDGSGTPLCLLSHVDVVTAEPASWTHPPLSGEIVDGYVWGRGALDMKGMGIVELETVLWLKRNAVPLARDVVLLAVADEEVDGIGMQALVAQWDRIGCSHLLNEGGLGLDGALFDGQVLRAGGTCEVEVTDLLRRDDTLYIAGVTYSPDFDACTTTFELDGPDETLALLDGERAMSWLVTATGMPGHGSVPDPDVEAPARLLAAMGAVDRRYRADPHIDPAMRELLRNAGRERGGIVRMILGSRVLTGLFVRPRLLREPTTAAAITDTVHLTGMAGANMPNVVPGAVWALYDCRLLPGTTPAEMVERMEWMVRKVPGITVELLDGFESNRSSVDDPLYARIAHYAVEDRPGHVAGPLLSVGFTDSLYARPLGVHAYGYVPFVVGAVEADSMHGNDERVSVENLREGTRRLYSIVVDFAGR